MIMWCDMRSDLNVMKNERIQNSTLIRSNYKKYIRSLYISDLVYKNIKSFGTIITIIGTMVLIILAR